MQPVEAKYCVYVCFTRCKNCTPRAKFNTSTAKIAPPVQKLHHPRAEIAPNILVIN